MALSRNATSTPPKIRVSCTRVSMRSASTPSSGAARPAITNTAVMMNPYCPSVIP